MTKIQTLMKKKQLIPGLWDLTGDTVFCHFFQPYLGGSLGMKWTDSFSWENIGFAWKVNGGIRIPLSFFTVRTDISYGTILGLAGIVAVGMYF